MCTFRWGKHLGRICKAGRHQCSHVEEASDGSQTWMVFSLLGSKKLHSRGSVGYYGEQGNCEMQRVLKCWIERRGIELMYNSMAERRETGHVI